MNPKKLYGSSKDNIGADQLRFVTSIVNNIAGETNLYAQRRRKMRITLHNWTQVSKSLLFRIVTLD